MTLPLDRFGQDHWSTFAYIETCCVDHQGRVEPSRMRSDGVRHPSRLKGGETLAGHNDWECANDLEAAGLLRQIRTDVYALTDKGWRVAGQLRRCRASGKNYSEFVPPEGL